MQGFLIHAGYPALVLLAFPEGCCIPISSEVVFGFAGVLAYQGHLNLPLVIIAALQVAIGADVLYTIRLRTLDGAPIFVERCTYPGWLAATIAQLDESCPSVTAEVRRLIGTVAVTGTHTLDLARADETDAELLGCQPGDPVLRRRAVTRRADGVPCDYTDDHYLEGAAAFTLRNSVTTNVLSRYLNT
jgi:GntR family transcriptional regulator